jgi:HEAT repeats
MVGTAAEVGVSRIACPGLRLPLTGVRGPRPAERVAAALLVLACLSVPARAAAQHRVVALVDFYGVEHLSRPVLLAALRVHPGDTLPDSEAALDRIARRLTLVPGVQHARLEPVCCDGDRYVLFVGIEERGAPRVTFRRAPRGSIRIADTLRTLSDTFFVRMFDGLKAGQSDDDLSQGHSLLAYAPARAIQEMVLGYAAGHEAELRRVLHQSADDESRAIAVWALGYAPDKRTVIPDLVYAAGDPYEEVRNNAVRALWGIGTLARNRPDLGLRTPYEPLLTLLHSPVWTDRNKVGLALAALSEGRDTLLLGRLRREGLTSLVEMARWQSGHALAPYLVVARIAGVSDSAAFAAWQRGAKESVIMKALGE